MPTKRKHERDDELYRVKEVTRTLGKLNPHLQLKETGKNPSNFSVDFVLSLGEHQTVVAVPMDRFRDYDRLSRKATSSTVREIAP